MIAKEITIDVSLVLLFVAVILFVLAAFPRLVAAWMVPIGLACFAGAFLAAALGAGRTSGYGALSEMLPVPVLAGVLFVVGILIGYGARWAGGCTSGHGISGCSAGSPESLAATTTFFGVAVAVTLVVHLLTGGAV